MYYSEKSVLSDTTAHCYFLCCKRFVLWLYHSEKSVLSDTDAFMNSWKITSYITVPPQSNSTEKNMLSALDRRGFNSKLKYTNNDGNPVARRFIFYRFSIANRGKLKHFVTLQWPCSRYSAVQVTFKMQCCGPTWGTSLGGQVSPRVWCLASQYHAARTRTLGLNSVLRARFLYGVVMVDARVNESPCARVNPGIPWRWWGLVSCGG